MLFISPACWPGAVRGARRGRPPDRNGPPPPQRGLRPSAGPGKGHGIGVGRGSTYNEYLKISDKDQLILSSMRKQILSVFN